MRNDIFINISKIIERDSKSTTYKFALLRGVIEIIQDNSPFISFANDSAHFPTGLLIEKWMLYYYPIFESLNPIPQINGEANLAFVKEFEKIIMAYAGIGGFSAFYNDLKNKGIPAHLQSDFIALANKLQSTITDKPMRHIGHSIYKTHYSIFQFQPKQKSSKSVSVDVGFLIKNYGSFSIPIEYYEVFQVLGSFINGQDSILFKWAEFSVNASGKNLSLERVLNEVLKGPITERDILESKKIYQAILKKEGKVFCVWTGKAITNFDVDHLIPFSVWKNNDLWNLLPSQNTTNNQKRDKIPSVELVEKRKDLILHYWNLIHENQAARFEKEMQVTLLGNNPFSSWSITGIEQLKNSCDYLITKRGFEEWKI